jgi:hypothetical protein
MLELSPAFWQIRAAHDSAIAVLELYLRSQQGVAQGKPIPMGP